MSLFQMKKSNEIFFPLDFLAFKILSKGMQRKNHVKNQKRSIEKSNFLAKNIQFLISIYGSIQTQNNCKKKVLMSKKKSEFHEILEKSFKDLIFENMKNIQFLMQYS